MNVLVVGAGVMGLSAARSLLLAGHDVTIVDPGPASDPTRASSDEQRLIRIPYGRRVGYQQMARDAFGAWDRLWEQLGRVDYVETGSLITGPAESEWIATSLAHLDRSEVRILSPNDVFRLVPGFRPPAADVSFLVPRGGVLMADRILQGLNELTAAARRRAGLVVSVSPESASCEMADGTRLTADRVILSLGAAVWPAGAPSAARNPSRQTAMYLNDPGSTDTRVPFVLDLSPKGGFYFVPGVDGTSAKMGTHTFSMQGSHSDNRECSALEVDALEKIRQGRGAFCADWSVRDCRACYYDVTPSERFLGLVDRKAIWLGGFSGHGFKFAPLIGERVVALVDGRLTESAFRNWLGGQAPH
ncbi:MAG: glycine/D-amino acid oxidase-like deaminating enzyme [Rhodothermales bacterium]|jgi:glycine/D-amino acid oxidase-like deaminating enzyme